MEDRVLEIRQWWGEDLLDARMFHRRERVTIGLGSGTRWRFLGVDMGPVPNLLGPVLAAVAPGWSDVERERLTDFAVPDPTEDGDWDLVCRRDDGAFVARIPDGWEVSAAAVDADGVREVALDGETVVVSRGEFRFELRCAARPERVESRMTLDPSALGAVGSVVLLLATVGLLSSLAPPARAVATAVDPNELIDVMLQAPPPPTPVKAKSGDPGEKAKNREGAREDHHTEKARPGRRSAKEVAEDAGVMHLLDSVVGGAELDAGLVAGAGSLIGFNGSGPGGHGLGSRGPGIGGGGTAEGIGGIGPRGRGPGGPGLYDGGGAKREGVISTSEHMTLIGALDRAQVDEVIKRNLSSIRYCYQRELQRAPDLGGKVNMKFTISGDGSVSAAKSSGSLENDSVRTCLEGRFLHLKFPEPAGNGIVVVSYPFLFSPG